MVGILLSFIEGSIPLTDIVQSMVESGVLISLKEILKIILEYKLDAVGLPLSEDLLTKLQAYYDTICEILDQHFKGPKDSGMSGIHKFMLVL